MRVAVSAYARVRACAQMRTEDPDPAMGVDQIFVQNQGFVTPWPRAHALRAYVDISRARVQCARERILAARERISVSSRSRCLYAHCRKAPGD